MNLTIAKRGAKAMFAGLAERVLHIEHESARVLPTRSSDGEYAEMRVRFAGRTFGMSVRQGTLDADIVRVILRRDSEYRLPDCVHPKVIFDCGANIGATAVYYSVLFPEADIYCFEPVPANLELLRLNTQRHSDRIRVIPTGLSDAPGSFEFHPSNDPRNHGGGSFARSGVDMSRTLSLPVITVEQAMREVGVDHIDLFKIDTEGAELPIVRGIPEDIRANAQAFIGELHGVGDWELCELLSRTHDVGVNKRYDAGCYPFVAVRKGLV